MIAGLGQAAQLVSDNVEEYGAHMREVRDYLEEQLEVSDSHATTFNIGLLINYAPRVLHYNSAFIFFCFLYYSRVYIDRVSI